MAPAPLEFVRYGPIGKTLLVLGGQKTARLCHANHPIQRSFAIEAPGESHLCAGGFLTLADLADMVVVAASDGIVASFTNGVIRVSDAEFVALDVQPSLPMFATGWRSDDMTFKMWVAMPTPEEDESPLNLGEKSDTSDGQKEGKRGFHSSLENTGINLLLPLQLLNLTWKIDASAGHIIPHVAERRNTIRQFVIFWVNIGSARSLL
jgi:hypothetical protein